MSYNPASGFPRIMPSLRYADVGNALTWLSHTFGLKEHLRWADENGIIRHAEMRIDTAFIEIAQAPEGSVAPKGLGQMWQSLVVLVDDVDTHYQRAKVAGATIIAEPQDKPWGFTSVHCRRSGRASLGVLSTSARCCAR